MTTAGEYALYSEATAGDAISTTAADLDWDTNEVTEPTGISRSVASVTLTDSAAHFLVIHSTGVLKGANPTEVKTWLSLNAVDLAYGAVVSTTQGSNSTTQAFGGAATIIVTGGTSEVLKLRTQLTSTGANATRRSNGSGLQVMRLDDAADYFRARYTGTAIAIGTSYTNIDFDVQDEYDTGTFTHSTSTNPEQITLKTAGHYLVCVNVMCNGSNHAWGRLRLNGTTTIEGMEASVSYVGGVGGDDHTLNIYGIINVAANDVLAVEMQADTASTVTALGSDTSISIVKLSDTADYIILNDSTAQDMDSSTEHAVAFNTEAEKDAGSFGHDTVTNNSRVEIDQADDYLFFGQQFGDHSEAGTARGMPTIRFRKNGTTAVGYAQSGAYTRDGQGWLFGASVGAILPSLIATDYVELTADDFGSGAANMNSITNSQSIQAVNIATLFAAAPAGGWLNRNYWWGNY